jgi:hypothetical protein
MWTADTAIVTEHFALLAELFAIGYELNAIERQHGAYAEIDDARRWQYRLCVMVLAQLNALLQARPVETVH